MRMTNMKNNISVCIIDSVDADFFKPDETEVESWVKKCLLDDFKSVSINLALVSTADMARLNIDFRGKTGPTNVLSFPEENDDQLIGEIVICSKVAEEEAISKSVKEYFIFLFVHGMLHLQGYDHINDNEAEIMEELEQKILCEILAE